MAGDAALYSRILGAALDDRADGLGAQAAPWLAGLIEALEQRPVCNPRRIHPGADPYHCRPADVLCDPFAFLIRLQSPNGEGVSAFGFEVGNVERGSFRHPEHGVTHDGDDRGVPKAFDGPSIVGRYGYRFVSQAFAAVRQRVRRAP